MEYVPGSLFMSQYFVARFGIRGVWHNTRTGRGGTRAACEDSVCPCSEAGILDAIARGGGPYAFACDGPTTVRAKSTIPIDNDVILDGEDELALCVESFDRLFRVSAGVSAELRRLRISCGGIANDGDLTLEEVTMTSSPNLLDGDAAFGQGDGIRNTGTLVVRRSNVTGNTAEDSEGSRVGIGGGIFNSGTMQLTESTTLTDNKADGGADAIMNAGRLVLSSTIVDGDCLVAEAASVVSEGGNIEVPGDSCGLGHPTDQVDVAAESLKLGPLADSGGPTSTHALMVGSVAIDVVPELSCVDTRGEPLITDQRDEPRPEAGGSMCDVGSFERQGTD